MWRYLPVLLLLSCAPAASPRAGALGAKLSTIDAGGTLGVSVLHVETGQRAGAHAAERFKMYSVVKLPLAIAVLDRVDQGTESLDAKVTFTAAELRSGPPGDIGERFPSGTTLTVRELLTETLQTSDNTACDLLLERIGGPGAVVPALTRRRPLAIDVSRSEGGLALAEHGLPYSAAASQRALVDRLDTTVPPEAHRKAVAAFAGDGKDTATPDAMADLLALLQRGELLSPASTRWLLDTMAGTKTGIHRLRAGLPATVPLQHKTGTGSDVDDVRIAIGDVGLVSLPDGTHLAIATFVSPTRGGDEKAEAAMASAARLAWDAYAGTTRQ